MLALKTKAILAVGAWAVLNVSSIAQGPTTTAVTIKVTDQTWHSIPRASIRVVPAPDTSPGNMETDSKGELLLQLRPGGHAIFASAQGFRPYVSHIEVGQWPQGQQIPVMLRIGEVGSPTVASRKEIEEEAKELFLSALPYHEEWWITSPELKAMSRTSVLVHNLKTNKDENYQGVRLSDLLAIAGAPLGKEFLDLTLSSYLRADGEVFSLAELEPGLHSGEIMVADSMNGQPIGSRSGPFMLVVSADERRIRWVSNLRYLELKR